MQSATAVGGYGVCCGGDGAAHHDVVGADGLGGGGGHDPLLVPRISVGKPNAGGDGDKILSTGAVDFFRLQGGADHAVQPCILGGLGVVHDHPVHGLMDHQVPLHGLLIGGGQLGAILAVVVLFWGKLWPFGLRQGRVISKPSVWNLWFKVVAATLPVLVISPLDDWMEAHFYNYITVAAMLILYGVLFLVVENRRATPHVMRLEQITYRDALLIGVWQCLAIIPGTSRSGATIVGGLLLGLSRACVAEFTFYLAIPVMAGASLLKVVKFVLSGAAMTGTEIAVLVVGCVVAFAVSMGAIRFLMDYVKRHNFKFFGVYRIVLGLIVLAVAAITALA